MSSNISKMSAGEQPSNNQGGGDASEIKGNGSFQLVKQGTFLDGLCCSSVVEDGSFIQKIPSLILSIFK